MIPLSGVSSVRRALLALAAAGGAFYLWSRSGAAGATAVAASNADEPFAPLSELADSAVAAVVGWEIPARGEPLRPTIDAAGTKDGIPPHPLARVLLPE